MIKAIPIAINILVALFAPYLIVGLVNKVKGLWAGRRGPRLLQPFYDFFKLLRKGEVLSETAGWALRIAPSIQLAASLGAIALVPLAGGVALCSFEGDVVLFAYLLALGRFAGALSALDTGSSFAGMGASRETLFSALAEPAFFIVVGSVALFSGVGSFQSMIAATSSLEAASGIPIHLALGLGALVFFILLLVECSRLPVDDPATHLELTMVHEAMILDNSGPDLGFIQYATALKALAFSALAAGFIVPTGLDPIVRDLLFAGTIAVIAILVGLIESIFARMRMGHVPQFILLSSAMALLSFVLFLQAFGGPR